MSKYCLTLLQHLICADLILVFIMVFAKRLQKGLNALVTVIMMERRASVSIFYINSYMPVYVFSFKCIWFTFTKTVQLVLVQ